MSATDPNLTPDPRQKEDSPSYTPASFEKRTAAWVGIAYVLMVLFVFTYSIFTGGGQLPGTFPLFLVPISVAAAVIALHRKKMGTAPLALTILVLLCALAGVLFGLGLGVPPLLSALQNPYGM